MIQLNDAASARGRRNWRALWLFFALALGFSSAKFIDWFFNSCRPANDGLPSLHVVKLGELLPEHRWLEQYNVFVAPADGIRSASSYALMVITPKLSNARSYPVATTIPLSKNDEGMQAFELSGFSQYGEVKPVHIDARSLSQHPEMPALLILDFIDHRIVVQDNAVFLLQSRKR